MKPHVEVEGEGVEGRFFIGVAPSIFPDRGIACVFARETDVGAFRSAVGWLNRAEAKKIGTALLKLAAAKPKTKKGGKK